jgi:predicted lipase
VVSSFRERLRPFTDNKQTYCFLSIFNRWSSVTLQVLAIVGEQVAFHPDYSIVTTGHSLGGSLALLAAVTLRQTFPDRYEPIAWLQNDIVTFSSVKLGHTLTVLPVPE